MSTVSATEKGLNAKRTALHLTGLPLLALSFQTLGTSLSVKNGSYTDYAPS